MLDGNDIMMEFLLVGETKGFLGQTQSVIGLMQYCVEYRPEE